MSKSQHYYVFVDVDGNLIQGRSTIEFLRLTRIVKYKRQKFLGLLSYVVAKYTIVMLKLFGANRSTLNKHYYRFFKGYSIKQLQASGKLWFYCLKKRHADKINHSLLEELSQHKLKGAEVFLVSGSSKLCLNGLKVFFSIDDILATELEFKVSKATGNIKGSIMIGDGKQFAIHKLVGENKQQLRESFAYGGPISDLPMLLAVGNKVVVGADKLMLNLAAKNGWRVLTLK